MDAAPLAGKVAVVTGGGRGIGRAVAITLSGAGADVCVVARTRSQVDAVAAEILGGGRRSLAIAADLTDQRRVEAMADEVRRELGRIDVLVNNAGGGADHIPVIDSDPQSWIAVIDRNLVTAYRVTRALVPLMIESGGGKVINVGSALARLPVPGAYSVAKAGLWMLTRQLAGELWDKGIDVNELVPGPVLTDATKDRFTVGAPVPSAPSERVKAPEDVGPLALWLATQPAGGPTGQSFSLGRRPLS
jgi:3-oxoacyl-[acyl-carrier protein] reductase